jgi:uncharacterized cupin superfamily protein
MVMPLKTLIIACSPLHRRVSARLGGLHQRGWLLPHAKFSQSGAKRKGDAMPRIDLDIAELRSTTGYPPPFDADVAGRWQRRLAPLAGLTALCASHVLLKPGAWSSQRHWHEGEDEFLVMLSGEAVLIEDDGETILRAGDCAAWAKGVANGHHLINRSDADCMFLCLSAGDRDAGGAYSDIDMIFARESYLHRDGTPYPARRLP